jgi:hypothetical protein
MSRRIAVVVVVCAAGVILVAAVAAQGRGPMLTFADGVPADLRALTTRTWERFVSAFPAHRNCMAPVTVGGAWSFGDRGAYDPDLRLVTVRVPATAPNLEAALVHEFAHHLDFTCPTLRGLRPAFLADQGFPPNVSWWRGNDWESTPSEQFAEAATVLVLGRRPSHIRVDVTPGALETLRDWAGTK